MELIHFFNQSLSVYLVFIGILGLTIGSFLNVVIVRLPIIINESNDVSLLIPRSFCQNCQQAIKPYDNIPLLSYLWLKGLCRHCQQSISIRYPAVEALTATLSVITAFHFGVTYATLFALILCWSLIVLSFIDFETYLLPDNLTLPCLWLGLALSIVGIFTHSEQAILGAILGYLSLWLVYWIFKITTGKEGMGYGDFKLLAMLGAWVGYQLLPFIILLASLLGGMVGLCLIYFRKRDKNIPIPFGPFLAFSGWIALLWGKDFTAWLLQALML